MHHDLDERLRSGKAMSESMGNFHVTGWDSDRKALKAAFTDRRVLLHERHDRSRRLQAWLDAVMAHAVMRDTGHVQTVFSLEIKASFREKVSPDNAGSRAG